MQWSSIEVQDREQRSVPKLENTGIHIKSYICDTARSAVTYTFIFAGTELDHT